MPSALGLRQRHSRNVQAVSKKAYPSFLLHLLLQIKTFHLHLSMGLEIPISGDPLQTDATKTGRPCYRLFVPQCGRDGRTPMTTATALSPQIVTGSARASSRAEMDAAVATLQESKGAWTAVSVRERREI